MEILDIFEKVEYIAETVTAIAGFILGWFGKKRKDKK